MWLNIKKLFKFILNIIFKIASKKYRFNIVKEAFRWNIV